MEPLLRMNKKLLTFYKSMLLESAKMSYASRNKVGSIIVKDNNIISYGYNGTPYGFDNKCEDEKGFTKKEVLHAESNAIIKCCLLNISTEGSAIFSTLSPCIECSKLIIQAKIKDVFYMDDYRDVDGLNLLKKAEVNVYKI